MCGGDVLDTQPRTKDQDTGKYQHQDCHARSSRSISPPHAAHSATSRTGALGADSAAANDAARDCAAEKAKAEVAALLAAVEAARAELGAIAEAKQQAEAALAETEARAVTASSQTPSTISGPADAVRGFESTLKSGPSSAPRTKLPAAGDLKTTTLLPDSKHAFLSYQWDVQENVKEIKGLLNERGVKCWMDIDGGMKADMYDSMAEGVAGAACVICFMTQAYQDSANCKLELKFAQQSGVPIIPVMMQANLPPKAGLVS